jgi:hypothetical protein
MPDSTTFDNFEIEGIWRVRTDPDIFLGSVTLSFSAPIDGEEFGQHILVKVRVKHSRGDSVQSLEQKIFETARGLLDHAAQTIREETAESLHARDKERRKE